MIYNWYCALGKNLRILIGTLKVTVMMGISFYCMAFVREYVFR